MDTVPLVMRTIRAEMRRRRAADLSVPQFRTLVFVNRYPGSSLSDVAAHLGSALPSASRLIDGLVNRRMVERVASPADRRRVELRITDEGRHLLLEARLGAQGSMAGRLKGLSPAELVTLERAMRILGRTFGDAQPTTTRLDEDTGRHGD